MRIIANLNQEKAIKHGNGPCLVLAGPGSGKTYLLTNRVYNLVSDMNIDPKSILVITFTKAAALEMRQRYIAIVKKNFKSINKMPRFGTFHSVFYDILKNDFDYNAKSLLNSSDERILLSQVLENYKSLKVNQDLITNILKDIKLYKMSIERGEKFLAKYLSEKLFDRVYSDYQEKLFNNKKLDFSDMIFNCYELLKSNKRVLKYYQNQYKYILIDEFQDINKLQYELVKLICKNKNIFVVGDDDQSIYGFRGSNPKVMKDFLKDFKRSKVINLNENYRCARQIVKFSKQVIGFNTDRFDKNLVSNREELGGIEIKAFIDSIEENQYVIDLIKKYRRLGRKLTNMAILYRTNLLSNSIKQALKKNGIEYKINGEDKNIYDHFAIKDIISYLRLAIGKSEDNDFINIANKPLRYLSRDAIIGKNFNIDELIRFYSNKNYIVDNLYKLKNDLKIINKMITPLAIRYIRSNVRYDKYLKDYCTNNEICYEDIEEMLDAFEEESLLFNKINDFLIHLEDNKLKIESSSQEKDSINLMTFHLSKGLEFDTVFIIDSNDGLIPHKKSIREDDLETERRLFYVAMTRAKNNLHIFFTTRRFGKDYKPSRFIVDAIGGKNG